MVDATTLAEQSGIMLDPTDWFRATWRDLDPLPRPDYSDQEQPEWATMTPEQYLRSGLDNNSRESADRFARHVVPYLSREERQSLAQMVRTTLATLPIPASLQDPVPVAYLFAAYLGVHEPLETLIVGWPDGAFGKRAFRSKRSMPYRPYDLIMGLGDPDQMIFHMRRLVLPLGTPETIRVWLANTERSALDLIQRCILAERGIAKAAGMIEALGLVHSPVVAPLMLETMANSKGGGAARKWLDDHPDLAIPGLASVAKGRNQLAFRACEYLQGLARGGQIPLLERHLETELLSELLDSSVELKIAPRFDKSSTPDWLHNSVRELRRLSQANAARMIDLERLPPLLIGQTALNTQQVEAIFLMIWLRISPRTEVWQLVSEFARALKEAIAQSALDEFVSAIVQGWLAAGAPVRERWLLGGLSLLGSDALILKFYPLVVQWAARNNKKLVRIGVECLGYVGTDLALIELFRLEHRLASEKFQHLVRKQIEMVMDARDLTEDELLDRTVPDCGLDEDGGQTFDYGPRQFRLALSPDLTPVIRDESGKLRNELPRPMALDNFERAETALNKWRQIKQQLHAVTEAQAVRLERQMVNEWHWSWPDFERFFLQHPYLQHLARLIIWGCYQPTLQQSFRINSEGAFVDAQDRPIEPDHSAKIGIVHPLHLTEAERCAWGQLLHDYEIIPPFAQIGRELFFPDPDELEDNTIRRFKSASAHILSVRRSLLKLGWQHHYRLQRMFSGFDVTAMIGLENATSQKRDAFAPGNLFFYAGTVLAWDLRKTSALPLAKVPPLVFSEVLRDLSMVFKN